MNGTYFFPGGNTPQGFVSRFDDILPPECARRMYFIKGGSGVGKSTFMRAVADYCADKGFAIEYFNCSSDPQSLDGIAIPALGVALMDGTAPHVMDPRIPGARDFLINLGAYLDESRLEKRLAWLRDIMSRRARCFARAYACLGGAGVLYGQAQREADQHRLPRADIVRAAMDALECELAPAHVPGRMRRLFSEAFTPDGMASRLDTLQVERCVRLKMAWAGNASDALEELAYTALQGGHDIILLMNPMCPDKALHVYAPALKLLICSDEGLFGQNIAPTYEIDARAAYDRHEFAREGCISQIAEAVKWLYEARELHAEVEKIYSSAMDFERANALRGEVCAWLDELMSSADN